MAVDKEPPSEQPVLWLGTDVGGSQVSIAVVSADGTILREVTSWERIEHGQRSTDERFADLLPHLEAFGGADLLLLEIRRHSFTTKGDARGRGSHLSRDGVAAARSLGARLGDFDHVVASTSPRTMETAIAMGFAVDDLMEMPSPTETGEVEFHSWREWNDPYTTLRAKSLESRAIAAFLDEQAKRALEVVDRLGKTDRVLMVGHGGWIESVVASLVEPDQLARVGGAFWHLDGIRLSVSTTSSVSIIDVERHQS